MWFTTREAGIYVYEMAGTTYRLATVYTSYKGWICAHSGNVKHTTFHAATQRFATDLKSHTVLYGIVSNFRQATNMHLYHQSCTHSEPTETMAYRVVYRKIDNT